MSERRARDLIARIESKLKPLAITTAQALWDATTTGTEETQAASVEAESALRLYLSSKEQYREIEELLLNGGGLEDDTRRQLELLHIAHLPNQLDRKVIEDLVRRGKKIESEFHNFRALLGGEELTDNEIIAILRNEDDDAKRRMAWEASKQIAPRVADELIELVKRRNAAARSLGHRDFYEMQLQLQEIDEGELFELFDELKNVTAEPFERAKADVDRQLAARFGIGVAELRPWHYADPFFQEPPLSGDLGLEAHFKGRDLLEIARDFFSGVDLPIEDVLERSDLEERKGKDQHAYCIDIDREGDVRILCNIKDDDRWMGILLHELGHAAYDKYIPESLPWLLREPAHIAMTEAIALFMDRLIYDVDWLRGAAGIALENSEEFQTQARATVRFEMLLMARWVLVMTYFERQLYADPDRAALDGLWWDLVEELQLMHRPEDRSSPDWAAKIHLTVAPVYYHNYQIGELVASQLATALRDQALAGERAEGFVGRRELGEFLRRKLFAWGSSLHWQSALREATGSELKVDAFVEEYVEEW